MLIRNYYTVDSMEEYEGGAIVGVSLDPSCEVYRGHFPSRAISPGVCSVLMTVECAQMYLEKLRRAGDGTAQEPCGPLRITEIHRCRFTKLVTPADTPRLSVRLDLTEAGAEYKLKAEILDGQTVCLTLDCTLIEE